MAYGYTSSVDVATSPSAGLVGLLVVAAKGQLDNPNKGQLLPKGVDAMVPLYWQVGGKLVKREEIQGSHLLTGRLGPERCRERGRGRVRWTLWHPSGEDSPGTPVLAGELFLSRDGGRRGQVPASFCMRVFGCPGHGCCSATVPRAAGFARMANGHQGTGEQCWSVLLVVSRSRSNVCGQKLMGSWGAPGCPRPTGRSGGARGRGWYAGTEVGERVRSRGWGWRSTKGASDAMRLLCGHVTRVASSHPAWHAQ